MAPTQHLFASRSLLTMVIVYRGGSGMEPAAPIIVVDSIVVAVFIDDGCC
jgi:hypothetical protein